METEKCEASYTEMSPKSLRQYIKNAKKLFRKSKDIHRIIDTQLVEKNTNPLAQHDELLIYFLYLVNMCIKKKEKNILEKIKELFSITGFEIKTVSLNTFEYFSGDLHLVVKPKTNIDINKYYNDQGQDNNMSDVDKVLSQLVSNNIDIRLYPYKDSGKNICALFVKDDFSIVLTFYEIF